MKYFLFGALSVIILGMLTAGAYLYGVEKGSQKYAPSPTPTAVIEQPTPTQIPTATLAPMRVTPTYAFPTFKPASPSAY